MSAAAAAAAWAGVVVAALALGYSILRHSNKLAALLERLTLASERHDLDLRERRAVDERHDGQLRDLTAAIRALAENNGRPLS